MYPTGHLRDGTVRVGGDARQRFYDGRGYGRPLDGDEIALSRVEAAHLLFRGDLSGIALADDADPVGFERFFVASAAAADRFAVRFLVYSDLRDRGFYLSPARDPWPGGRDAPSDAVDFVAYERGETPDTGNVQYPIQVVGERESIAASGLGGRTLAVVDEESEVTYFAAESGAIEGSTDYDPPSDLTGVLLADRVVVWDAPADLHERGFYGRPLTGRAADVEGALQLSLVEAASLATNGRLSVSETEGTRDADADSRDAYADSPNADAAWVVARGRDVEGERFDRRLAVYERLRAADAVPKTGFKFGADFRTYLDVETVEDLPHSEHLVRVAERDYRFSPRELSLDVRLAGGVRKEMAFALTAVGGDRPGDVEWVSIGRLTP